MSRYKPSCPVPAHRIKRRDVGMKFLYRMILIIVCSVLSREAIGLSSSLPSPGGGSGARIRSGEVLVSAFPLKLEGMGFTAEAWFLLEDIPKPGEKFVVLQEPGTFRISVISRPEGVVEVEFLTGHRLGGSSGYEVLREPKGKWHHVGVMARRKGWAVTYLLDGKAMGYLENRDPNLMVTIDMGGGNIIQQPQEPYDFNDADVIVIGPTREPPRVWRGERVKEDIGYKFASMVGYIDEIRISKGIRYEIKRSGREGIYQIPKGPFKADANTLALWHLSEGEMALKYKDSSGRGNYLIRAKEAKAKDVMR